MNGQKKLERLLEVLLWRRLSRSHLIRLDTIEIG